MLTGWAFYNSATFKAIDAQNFNIFNNYGKGKTYFTYGILIVTQIFSLCKYVIVIFKRSDKSHKVLQKAG
jgi:hypothetical protein